MDNLRGVLEYIRNYFSPIIPTTDYSRKRRAVDPIERYLSPKCRRLQSTMPRDYLDINFCVSPSTIRKSVVKTPPSRHIDTILPDDDKDVIEEPSSNGNHLRSRPKINTFTSTPAFQNRTHKCYINGSKATSEDDDDDDVTFVKEIKSPIKKKTEASKLGLSYIKPFTGSLFRIRSVQNGTKPKDKTTIFGGITKKSRCMPRPSIGNSLEYSFRLDDKMQYKKLLETAAKNDSSIYSTPVGKLFNYDTANRGSKILDMALKSPVSSNTSKERLSTRDRIQKVLDNFENDTVVLKDSDSDSDLIYVSPPSPKPDIKVEPINSLKKVVDTSQETKADWLQDMLDRHKNLVDQRQKEIDYLKECSEKHSKINKDMRLEVLTNKVNKALLIKDTVLPIDEKEEELELPELNSAQLKIVEKSFRGDANDILIKKFNLNITRRDLLTLHGLNWLNDEVINFYMNMIIERSKDSRWPKTYAFNTFFYTKLIKDGPQSLRRWTKKIDLFEYDLVCIPIHLGMHWCMAVIDFRDKSIRYYDSMGGNNKKCLEALQSYLEAEHLDKKKTPYDTTDFILENVKDIPQQMNGSDCGMFSCTFAEFLSRNAKILFSQEHMPYFRKKMVLEILTGELLIK